MRSLSFWVGLNNCFTFDGIMINGGLAGHCDWRLPTAHELVGLWPANPESYCTGLPCVDPIFLPIAYHPDAAFPGHRYWTSITYEPTNAESLGFDFTSRDDPKSKGNFVRAVRGGL